MRKTDVLGSRNVAPTYAQHIAEGEKGMSPDEDPAGMKESVFSQSSQHGKMSRKDFRAAVRDGRAHKRHQCGRDGGLPHARDKTLHCSAVRTDKYLAELAGRFGVLVLPVLVAFHGFGSERARQVRDRPQMPGGERSVEQLRIGGLGVEREFCVRNHGSYTNARLVLV